MCFRPGPIAFSSIWFPTRLRGTLQPGRRVKAPFGRGNRLAVGYCVRLENKSPGQRRLKFIDSLMDQQPLLSPALLELSRWMADYYLCPWGQVLEAVLPAGVRGQAGTREANFLSPSASVPADIATNPQSLQALKLPPRQAEALRHLAAAPAAMTAAQLCAAISCTAGVVQTLRKKGLLVSHTRRTSAKPGAAALAIAAKTVAREQHLTLEADQQTALAAILRPIAAGCHETVLIHGVTGSGKTEVYIQAIQEVLTHGRQAIVLVPEISLTPQTEERFRSRFGRVAVLHSHMSDSERHHHWQQIAAGEVSVVVVRAAPSLRRRRAWD